VLERTAPGQIRLDLLTDPWSVWCWGFEPVRRALALRYPEVQFRALVGGMFPKLPKPEELGFDVGRFFATVQRSTGMPIRPDAAQRDRPDSTFPACVAVHAVRLLKPEREAAFLRALREAAYLDGANVSRPDAQAEAAARAGVDAREFTEALASGEPEREFRERLAQLQGLNLRAYPTLLLTSGRRTARVEGFQSLPAVLSIAESLAARALAPRPAPTLEDVVPRGERVATREVAEALGLSVEAAYDRLRTAEQEGSLRRQRWATGDTWSRA
jgi:protein-disulfide isomerase-like protein with CxxC motif